MGVYLHIPVSGYNVHMLKDTLEGLNDDQINAVTSTEGYVRVIAGAGSGKTRALTHRFAYLVNELGIRPGNILCVTFTNKAAAEMKSRIHELTDDNDTGYICTFHSFCVTVLQEDSHAVSYPRSFMVLDNSDIDDMLSIIYEERGLTLRDMTYAHARDMFEIRKGVTEQNYYMNLIQMSLDDLHQKYMEAENVNDILFYGYLYQEKKCFGLDYNDLIFLTLYIFRKNPEIRLKWQKRLEYIMIDEFQDIDEPQYELMENLCGYHNNLFIVGDPDQTIYTWRGAQPGFLIDFDRKFPHVKTIMMMKNYRSSPQILSAANSLIDCNHDRIQKELIPTLSAEKKPVFYSGKSPKKEAEWIAREIERIIEDGTMPGDIAVLYRAHYLTRPIEEVFLHEKLPYRIYSGIQFYERKEIKDAAAYLRMIAYKDDLSFMRTVNTPKRNIGQRRMRFLKEYAEKQKCTLYEAMQANVHTELFNGTGAEKYIAMIEDFASHMNERPVSEILSAVLDVSGYEKMLRTEGNQERLDDLAELKQAVYEWETSVGEETDLLSYLKHMTFFTSLDTPDAKDRVKLMTIHSAKGLEFPYVFLCGMNESIFPSGKVKTEPGMEEERRLCFVAMTRAEKELYLSNAEGRNASDTSRHLSRFLLDIDSSLLEFTEPLKEERVKKAKEYIIQLNSHFLPDPDKLGFQEGDRVRHRVFGTGTVKKIDMDEEAVFVKFDTMNTPRAISIRAAGKLEKIERS